MKNLGNYSPRLGVYLKDEGVQARVVAPRAKKVSICFINCENENFTQNEIFLEKEEFGIWSKFIPNIQSGQRYGFRAYGDWDPKNGLFYNGKKLLIDPYAKGLENKYIHSEHSFAYDIKKPQSLKISKLDSIDHVPHSVILDNINPNNTIRPQISWEDTILYETHIKGFSINNMEVEEHLRGTYLGLSSNASIKYLKELGITSVELLPIHYSVDESNLTDKGLTNYWGYSTANFFMPNPFYATKQAQEIGAGAVIEEVKEMIRVLHNNNIEVILDVVYNHSAEGGILGPTLSLKGLDNQYYYMTVPGSPDTLYDTTGTGNSLEFSNPRVVKLVIDSLKHWVEIFGVDGFRFDLAVTLGRNSNGWTREHALLTAIKNDELLGSVKLIAEPWDVGSYGWQTGQFGTPFAEWNDRFRNTVRKFWVDDRKQIYYKQSPSPPQDISARIAGSKDYFQIDILRKVWASINNVTVHDGFTLRDLVTYDSKHNECNGEDNKDGSTYNLSFNHGIEGESDNEDIIKQRIKTVKNILTTLILSRGTPMILGGDEIFRTQRGNNNAYCQDSDISYYDWNLNDQAREVLDATKRLIQIRKDYKFITSPDDIYMRWYNMHSDLISPEEWQSSMTRTIQLVMGNLDSKGEKILIVFNGGETKINTLLAEQATNDWKEIFSSEIYHNDIFVDDVNFDAVSPAKDYYQIQDKKIRTMIEKFSVKIFVSL